eukprot:TRINITY_DN24427_c0_g1_i1.p1 TRINITY_DN24427_c0_g1~~TRINITY_DN24427_c0_g1_i1.p1  ORF type:complete len:333 (+),score=77.49 TRINITY_DN24427_c0_g1_i1:90-1088(+)
MARGEMLPPGVRELLTHLKEQLGALRERALTAERRAADFELSAERASARAEAAERRLSALISELRETRREHDRSLERLTTELEQALDDSRRHQRRAEEALTALRAAEFEAKTQADQRALPDWDDGDGVRPLLSGGDSRLGEPRQCAPVDASCGLLGYGRQSVPHDYPEEDLWDLPPEAPSPGGAGSPVCLSTEHFVAMHLWDMHQRLAAALEREAEAELQGLYVEVARGYATAQAGGRGAVEGAGLVALQDAVLAGLGAPWAAEHHISVPQYPGIWLLIDAFGDGPEPECSPRSRASGVCLPEECADGTPRRRACRVALPCSPRAGGPRGAA